MMNKRGFYLVAGAALFMVLGLSSCLKSNDVPKIEYKRVELGKAKVNGKDFEHVVYLANIPYQNNPYLFYSKESKMAYFPIYLTPKGSDMSTRIHYAIFLYLRLENGVPELNKPYTIKPNAFVESLPRREFYNLFVSQKDYLLKEGGDGVALVYSKDRKSDDEKVSAEATITFTAFDVEKQTCTATYQLKAAKTSNLPALTVEEGTINTKIYTEAKGRK